MGQLLFARKSADHGTVLSDSAKLKFIQLCSIRLNLIQVLNHSIAKIWVITTIIAIIIIHIITSITLTNDKNNHDNGNRNDNDDVGYGDYCACAALFIFCK